MAQHPRNAWVDGSRCPTPKRSAIQCVPERQAQAYGAGSAGPGMAAAARDMQALMTRSGYNVFPFFPKDFDERYYQAAPEDRKYRSKGRMEVELSGFTADGVQQFMLPHFEAPVHVFPKRGEREDHAAALDTIAFERDPDRFTMRLARRAALEEKHARDCASVGGQEGPRLVAAARAGGVSDPGGDDADGTRRNGGARR